METKSSITKISLEISGNSESPLHRSKSPCSIFGTEIVMTTSTTPATIQAEDERHSRGTHSRGRPKPGPLRKRNRKRRQAETDAATPIGAGGDSQADAARVWGPTRRRSDHRLAAAVLRHEPENVPPAALARIAAVAAADTTSPASSPRMVIAAATTALLADAVHRERGGSERVEKPP